MVDLSIQKILILSPTSFPHMSGAGKSAFQVAKYFKASGEHDVEILTFRNNTLLKSFEKVEGISIWRARLLGNTPIKRRISGLFLLPFLLKRLRNYDCVIIYGPCQGIELMVLSCRLLGITTIFRSTMMDQDDVYTLVNKFKPLKWAQKFLMSQIDGFWAQLPENIVRYKRVFPEGDAILTIPNGVNTERFASVNKEQREELRRSFDLKMDEWVFVSVGFLNKRKGYDEMFKALANLPKEIKFTYVVVGNYRLDQLNANLYDYQKNEMESLFKMAKELLGDRVRFLGPRQDVEKILQLSDVFLFNSKKEGLPNVLLEAFSCGLPSVVSDMEWLQDYLIRDRQNCLISKGDFDGKILNLLNDETLRAEISRTARQTIEESFSMQSTLAGFNELIKKICKE